MDEEIYNAGSEGNTSEEEKVNEYRKGLAIAAFVLSLVNCFCCCCYGSPILATLSIIFAIVSLAKNRGGKPFAIIGLVLSTLGMLVFAGTFYSYGDLLIDMMKVSFDPNPYIEEYKETGEIPEEFEKYNESPYKEFFEYSQYGSFENYYRFILSARSGGEIEYDPNENYGSSSSSSDDDGGGSSSSSRDEPDDGETLVDLSYTGASAGMKLRAI